MRLSKCVRWLLPALMVLFVPAAAFAGVLITVNVAPPVLPVYEQPQCPQEGWMWVPGYWAYGDDGYYWVPGQWVPAPYQGALWTPPWWGWDGGHYRFHDGYWGDRVGYYGGINYGFGYMGVGFAGGEWRGDRFAYNTAVMRVNTNVIHNTYVNETIVRTNTIANERHVAFNGGSNGIRHDPTPVERTAMSGRHTAATPVQVQHMQAARTDRTSYVKVNGGHPHTLAVTPTAGVNRSIGAPAPTAHEAGKPGATAHTASSERTPPTSESQKALTRTTPQSHTAPSRPTEPRTAASPTESRNASARNESRNGSQARTAPPRTESHPSVPRTESHIAPTEKPKTASHATTASHEESRRAPESHAEARPAPAPKAESRPAPSPRTEPHTAESRPAPQHEPRPAPAPHAAPQHASHPAPAPKQEKPKPGTR
jgi:hypothetical protein